MSAARRILRKGKHLVTGAYVRPFQDRTRALILFAGMLGGFSYGVQGLALNYAMAGEGMAQSLIYQVLRMALMGFVGIPLTFWLLARGAWRSLFVVLQGLGVALYLYDPSSGFVNAVAFATSASSFWALYSYRYAIRQSRKNHGNETALSSYCLVLSVAAGLFLGGFLLEHGHYLGATIGGGLGGLIGTQFLYLRLPREKHWGRMWALIGWRKPSSRISFLVSLQGSLMDGCMPIWMRIIGLSPLATGLNLSLRPILGLILTPIVGWMIQRGSLRTGQVGGTAMVMGWILLAAATEYPWLFALALGVLTVATNLLNPMEVGRWYKRRSAAGIMAREFVLASGRVPAYAVGIATIFLMPPAFPLIGLAFGATFLFGLRGAKARSAG